MYAGYYKYIRQVKLKIHKHMEVCIHVFRHSYMHTYIHTYMQPLE